MRPKQLAFSFLLAASVFVLFAPSLLAQSAGTGALTGAVTDPTSAVVPNVTVTLTNTDTNQARVAVTAADGSYKFSLLQPGTYRVRFSAVGFKTAEVPLVTVNVTETPVLDQSLELGTQSERVTVEAQAARLQRPCESTPRQSRHDLLESGLHEVAMMFVAAFRGRARASHRRHR